MHLRRALTLYTNHFLSILLIGVIIVFPIQVVSFTYASQSLTLFGIHISSLITSIFIQLFFLNLMQIPFIQLADQVHNERKVDFKVIFSKFVFLLVPVSIMNVYYYLCVLIGLPLLIIPGIFMLVLYFIFPYTQVIEGKSGWELFKKTYYIGRSGFVDVVIISMIFICFNIIIWTLASLGLFWFDSEMNFGMFLLMRFIINCLILPIFVFVVTINYNDWQEDSEQVESTKRFGHIKMRG